MSSSFFSHALPLATAKLTMTVVVSVCWKAKWTRLVPKLMTLSCSESRVETNRFGSVSCPDEPKLGLGSVQNHSIFIGVIVENHCNKCALAITLA